MYVADINAQGGVNGQQIKLFIYDDGGDPNKARTFATRLSRKTRSTPCSAARSPAPPWRCAASSRMPTRRSSRSPARREIVFPVRKWVFKTPHTEPMSCGKIFEDMKKRNISKIAMISGTDGWGKAMRAECIKMAPQVGITVVKDENYGAADSDMTPQLTNIKNTPGVEAVINCGFGQGPAIVTRNYRQLGIAAPLYQSHGVSSKSYIQLAGAAAEGVRLPAAAAIVADQLPDSDPLKKVVTEYKTKFEKTTGQPVSTFGGHMYDALLMLVRGDAARQERRQGQGARRDREDQELHRHRRHGEHVADRPPRPRPHVVPHDRDQERRLGAAAVDRPLAPQRHGHARQGRVALATTHSDPPASTASNRRPER